MTLSILSLPPEVFDMIVGAISFVDLPNFLDASKAIKVKLDYAASVTLIVVVCLY